MPPRSFAEVTYRGPCARRLCFRRDFTGGREMEARMRELTQGTRWPGQLSLTSQGEGNTFEQVLLRRGFRHV